MSFLERFKGKQTQQVSSSAGIVNGDPSEQQDLESVGLFLLTNSPLIDDFDIDIVAVHGLGGHWEGTWKDSKTNKVWLRDFLPSQLRDSDAKIKPRIFSYGYNSRRAFNQNIMDINDVADDLLDRLSHVRQSTKERLRPILLIAHSLGGLIVKKAIITAWNQSNLYSELLQCILGIVFFGVPHRGADSTYWAGLPARLLENTLLGFGGNTILLDALKQASPTWREISIQFIQRAVPPLKIRTFFETEKIGNILVVDKDSARLFLSNEQFTAVVNSNHQSMCKFGAAESHRYFPVWMAIKNMAKEAIALTAPINDNNHQQRPNSQPVRQSPAWRTLEERLFPPGGMSFPLGTQRRRLVLTGNEKSRRTELITQFAHEYRERCQVFQLDASDIQQWYNSLAAMARQLNNSYMLPAVAVGWCIDWLRGHQEWLLLIHNMDAVYTIDGFGPWWMTDDIGGVIVISSESDRLVTRWGFDKICMDN